MCQTSEKLGGGLKHAGINFHLGHAEIYTGRWDFDDVTSNKFSLTFLSCCHRCHAKAKNINIFG